MMCLQWWQFLLSLCACLIVGSTVTAIANSNRGL